VLRAASSFFWMKLGLAMRMSDMLSTTEPALLSRDAFSSAACRSRELAMTLAPPVDGEVRMMTTSLPPALLSGDRPSTSAGRLRPDGKALPEEPAPPAEIYTEEPTPVPAATPAVRKGNAVTGILLKLTSLATLGLAGYWIYQNPTADLIQLGLVVLGGLGAALVEWHVSDL